MALCINVKATSRVVVPAIDHPSHVICRHPSATAGHIINIIQQFGNVLNGTIHINSGIIPTAPPHVTYHHLFVQKFYYNIQHGRGGGSSSS